MFSVLLAADDEEPLAHATVGASAAVPAVHTSGFEVTHFPCERLFDGDWRALSAAVDSGAFDDRDDDVEWLDRFFLLRESGGVLDRPRSPNAVLALRDSLEGRWWAVTADDPWDALAHVRDHQALELDEDGTCPECFVAAGSPIDDWGELIDVCQAA